MLNLEQYIKIVNEAISNYNLDKNPIGLYEPIKYTMSRGGKRLRPVLLLMACDALGGSYENAIDQAMGLEFFHNFTLLHDDVMDNADIRRGMPTVHKKWNENTAILSGDAMLTIATQMIARNIDNEKISEVLQLFNKTAMEIYEGQQFDMDFENSTKVSVDDYINMIRLKTSVLFGCACKMGAFIANAPDGDAQLMYDFGVNFGLAFQLQDDLLDVYGDVKVFGKETGGDIVNAKRTFMLIKAYQKADENQTERLNSLLTISEPERFREKIEGVTAIYDELDIRSLCNNEIAKYMQTAINSINKVKMTDSDKAEFINFVDKLMQRKK